MEAGDLIMHIDTNNNFLQLGVLQGNTTAKGRPYFIVHQHYDDRPKKVCASNYYMVFKITEEQLRAKGNYKEIDSLLEVRNSFIEG